MGQLRRFLGIFVSLFVILFAGNSHAAGYTCDDIKQYTSCVAGRYLNKSGAGNNCDSLCTNAAAPANQTNITNGTRKCTGNYTGGPADNTTVGSSACTGCSAYTCTCNSNYSASNQGASTCSCTPNVYTITLNDNGGSGGSSKVYEKYATGYSLSNFGTTVTSVTKPTKSGVSVTYNANGTTTYPASVSPSSASTSYTFNGYYTAASGGTQRITGAGALPSNTTFISNTTLYAQWTCNGVTLPTPTRTGFTFNGWYTAASGGTRIGGAGSSYCPTSATTLYAQWTPTVYTITLNDNGGSGGSSKVYEKYSVGYSLTNFGTTVTSVTKPTKSGGKITYNANGGSVTPTSVTSSYTFNGYYTSNSGGTQHITNTGTLPSNTTFITNTTLYAQWSCGTTLPTPTRTGYTFNGWYTAASGGTQIGNTGSKYCPSSDTTIYAHWTAKTNTITLNKNGGTGTCGGQSSTTNGSFTCTTASSATLPSWNSSSCNITKTNNVFIGWNTSSTATSAVSNSFTCPTGNATYYAVWKQPTCNKGTNGASASLSSVNSSNQAVCSCSCNNGYSQSGGTNATTTFTTTGSAGATSVTCSACYARSYTISYTLNSGTQASSGVPTSYTYGTGATVNGTPTRSGYTFEGWCTDSAQTSCAKTHSISTTATGNKTFYAKWSINATISNKSQVYNGNALTCSGVTGTPSGAEIKYRTATSGTYDLASAPTVTNVADSKTIYYQITATNAVTRTGSFTCTITRANGSISAISDQTLTYPTTKTVSVTRAGDGAVSASSSDTAVVTASVSGTTITLTPVKVGTATITVNVAQGSNHNAPTARTFNVTVNRGNCTVTLSRTSSSATYPNNPTTFTATKTGNGAFSTTVTTSNSSVATATISNGTITPVTKGAGSATLTVSTLQTDQYNSCSATHTVTVPKAAGQVVINPTSGSIAYRPGAASTTTIVTTNKSGGTISATSNNSNITMGVGADNKTITITSNGKVLSNATITVTSASTGNYNSANATYTLSSVTCGDGYYNKSGTCTACPENASACGGPDNPDEFTCDPGYVVKGDACEPASYTVTYNCGTGTGTAPSETTKPVYNASAGYTPKDNTCTAPAGHVFAGWKVSGTSDIRQPGSKFVWKYTENKTFTAQWDAQNDLTATYSCGDGTGTAPARDTGIMYNGNYTIKSNGSSNCSRTGYTFAGWSDGSKIVSGTITWNYTTSKTFTATWTPNTYTITLNDTSNGGTGGTGTVKEVYNTKWTNNSGTTITSVTKPTKSGVTVTYNGNSGSVSSTSASTSYTFNGYYTAASGGTQRITNAGALPSNTTFISNTTLYAQWTCNGVTLPTPTRTGYNFNGWYSAASGGEKIGNAGATYCPTSATTIYAQWTAATYTITLNDNNGTGGMGSIKEVYNTKWTNSSGATITSLTALPKRSGYLFNGYYTATSGGTQRITKTGGLPANTTFTSAATLYAQWSNCPANATCENNTVTCDENYNWSDSTQSCVLGTLACEAGKYYPGTGTAMVDCTKSKGFYCPGTGTAAIGGGEGCRVLCPESKNKGTLTTSVNGATKLEQCVESLSGVQIPKDSPQKNGTGDTVCKYTSIVDGAASYNEECNVTVTSCIDGYFVPVKDGAGYTKDGYCQAVGIGYYRAGGDCNPNPTVANDTCMRKACLAPGTTSTTTASSITQCHITCSQESIKDGSTTVGSKTPVSATLNYTGSAYPACTYTLTCANGYKKVNDNSATATCEPETYTVTLNIGYTGGTNQAAIYAKYNRGWYSNANATTAITKITVPTRANYTFAGYQDADKNTVINADGSFVSAKPVFTANTTLTAVWHGIPVTCVAGKYYTGVGTTMAPCRSGEYCPGSSLSAHQGAEGCFTKCPKSAQNGTLSSSANATSVNDCKETLTNVSIPKATEQNPNPVPNGTADTVCKYSSGSNGSAIYEKDCVATVKSCIAGYFVGVKEASTYTKQGFCEPVKQGYYRAAGNCNPNPTASNDTCMQIACPGSGTTDGVGATSANACYMICTNKNITLGGKTVGDAEPTSTKAMLQDLATSRYDTCKYNATCNDGYVIVEENQGTENPACKVGDGWTITYVGEGTDYQLPAGAIKQFTVETVNRTLPTPTRTGYSFEGWYENSNLTGTRLTTIPSDRTSAMTLYAKWSAKLYPITVNPNNGAATYTVYMRYNTAWYQDSAASKTITTLTVPDGNGNTFGGYYYGDTEVVNASGKILLNNLTPADNMEIRAKWQSNPITCPAGFYYPGNGSEANCQPCESGYYCEGNTVCESNDGKPCGRSTCPDFVPGTTTNVSSPVQSKSVTACRKSGVTYVSSDNHVAQGTATCQANTNNVYEYNAATCTDYVITKCVAGYWHGTSTAANKCDPVGKGYFSNGTSTSREQCPEGTTHVYASDGVAPQTVTARGTTAGDVSTASTACYLDNVPYTPANAHGKGTQRCFYNGFTSYGEDCINEQIRYCDGGYWRENANAKVCIPAGADHFSREGSLITEQCPARTDATGALKHGETANTVDGKEITATSPEACMLRVPYSVAHGTGTKLCSFNELSGTDGQYDKNCGDMVITSCEGGYYRPVSSDGKVSTEACVEVGNNYYRAAGNCTVEGGIDSCMRNACPNGGYTAGTVNTSVTQCYNTNLSYVSDANHVKAGTQTCFATVAGLYTDRCKDFAITKCVAGYWRNTTTPADKCVAVGQGYYSDGNNVNRTQCPTGVTHVYTSDGVAPQTVDARGTTDGDTSIASTACYLVNVPYTPTNGHGKGTQKCFYDGFASYNEDCINEQIRYCDAGYWRENESAKVCIPAGADHFSREGSLITEQCPARTDATGALKHGETANTADGKEITATSPEACMLRVPYSVAHGTGTKLCSFNELSGSGGQYDKNCGDMVITSCEGGYYRPVVNGVAKTDACVEVGKNFYRPQGVCKIENGNDTCMRIACPNNGLTIGTTSISNTACYLEKLMCVINHGRGENTCNYNPTSHNYDSNCTTCQVTGCESGYTTENGACVQCPAGYVCEDGPDGPTKKTCATMTDNQYPKSDAGAGNISMCYRDCAMGQHATSMTGRDYYGNNQCHIAGCETGYILSGGKCQVCPEGSYCPTDNPDDKMECPVDWSHSDGLATKKENCYRTCEAYPIEGGTAVPVREKAFYPNKCEFKGVSDNGNECDIVDDKCVEVSCRSIYEMINGKCVPCNREHALSYLPNGNCMVASCEIGYHPNGQSCEYDVKECVAPNAIRASQRWDSKLSSFSTCMIEECEDGYHIASNACVADEQVCAVEHGVGIKEWNSRTNSWGECVATSCDAGYTNDPSETNERSKQCGQCKNKFSVLGEMAASTYIRGCEIASCLYQGELYNLENNECVPICDVNGREDETGTMKWDASRKKCVRTCKEGYTTW